MQNLDQNLRVDNLVTPQSSTATATIHTNSDMFRSMAKYRKGLVIVTAELDSADTVTATLKCATNASGSGSANVSATAKVCTLTGQTGGTSEVGTIEFDVSDLTAVAATKYFVGVDLTPSDGDEFVAVTLVRGAARYYMGSSMPA